MNIWWTIFSFFLRLCWPIFVFIRKCWDIGVGILMRSTVGVFRKRTPMPPIFNPLLVLPATVLAENIRNRKMTSVEVARAFITRCSDVNAFLNAIVQENFQDALQRAKHIDDYIDQGYKLGTLTRAHLKEWKPFLGVPFTVKETIAVEDFPHTGGLLVRKNVISYEDAEVVKRMKDAGAILLATTNVPELGMWWECSNPLYGITNNPYDSRRTCGGSSGGEAALMCAGGSPISIGTDIGGSIRTPAFFCGLFGHKPTADTIPVTGCNIHNFHEDTTIIQVAGPLLRHSADLIPVMKVLAGDNVSHLDFDISVHLSRLQVYTIGDDGNGVLTSSVASQLREIQKKVEMHFIKSYDITVSKLKIPDFQRSFWIWQDKMEENYPNYPPITSQLLDNEGEINVFTEFMRNILGRPRHSLPSLFQAAMERIIEEVKFLRDLKRILQGKDPDKSSSLPKRGSNQLKMRIQRLLGDNAVILYPSHPTLAPFHRETYFKPFNFTYCAIFNALGFPVTQVPLGIDAKSGLPMGIQVIGGLYQDRLTIAVAKDLEAAFGGWVCPAKIL